MPESNLKQGISESDSELTRSEDPSISDTWMIVVEKVCSLTGADGAVIAIRDPQGARCVASTGDAPPVGSRLQPDSEFTRECFETGSVMFCKDALADSRIRPSIAQMLNLRSVLAVPIQAQGSVLGLVEVFSSRPFAFDTTHVAALQEIADLLGPFSALGSANDATTDLVAEASSSDEELLGAKGAESSEDGKNCVVIAISGAMLLVLVGAGAFLLNNRSGGNVVATRAVVQTAKRESSPVPAAQTMALGHPTLKSTSSPITLSRGNSAPPSAMGSTEAPSPITQAKPSVPVEPSIQRAFGALESHPVSRQPTNETQVEVPAPLDPVVPPSTESTGLFGTPPVSNVAPPSVSANKANGPVAVGGQLREPRLLSSVLPEYPTPRIEGDVVVSIVIDKGGNVSDAQAVSGPPSLRQAALNAVRRWKYEPSKLDGQPTAVQMRVTIRFRL